MQEDNSHFQILLQLPSVQCTITTPVVICRNLCKNHVIALRYIGCILSEVLLLCTFPNRFKRVHAQINKKYQSREIFENLHCSTNLIDFGKISNYFQKAILNQLIDDSSEIYQKIPCYLHFFAFKLRCQRIPPINIIYVNSEIL